jgi:hypothetical protein
MTEYDTLRYRRKQPSKDTSSSKWLSVKQGYKIGDNYLCQLQLLTATEYEAMDDPVHPQLWVYVLIDGIIKYVVNMSQIPTSSKEHYRQG